LKKEHKAAQERLSDINRAWLSSTPIKIAFLNAQKAIKVKYPDPYYWAAFIMLNNN
jgi:CHAT domain-containing protein